MCMVFPKGWFNACRSRLLSLALMSFKPLGVSDSLSACWQNPLFGAERERSLTQQDHILTILLDRCAECAASMAMKA